MLTMKKYLTTCLLLFSASAFAQYDVNRHITLKWSPTSLIIGTVGLQAEYNFGSRYSLTANIGLPATVRHTLTYQDSDAAFDMRASTFLAGYRCYLSDRHLSGIYLEPFFKYIHHSADGLGTGELVTRTATFNIMNEYNAMGVGAQFGAQFLISNRVAIDLFLIGPEFDLASNNLKAVELSGSGSWSNTEAAQAEVQIKNFIQQIPFIRNHTDVMLDKENRLVTARFKGPLPSVRAGVSLGIAF